MATTSTRSPLLDAIYLRRLLDRQPASLIRVRLDGVLLACNDAGLGLFGGRKLAAVLNTNLTDHLVAGELSKWREFTARVWEKNAASLETYLAADADVRPVLVHGIALKDHPDGVESLLLTVRDQSQTHRLERSIRSAEINRAGQEERLREARDQFEQAVVERMQLAAVAEQHQAEHDAERRQLIDALDAQIADRQRREAKCVELEKRVEESQLALLAQEGQHRRSVAALEATITALQAAQAISASAHEQQAAQREQEAAAAAERHRQEIAELQLRLQMSTAEAARLGIVVAEHEGQRQQLAVEHRAAVDALERALDHARAEAVAGRDEANEVTAALRAQLSEASAEQSRLASRVAELELERGRTAIDHQRAVADLETRKDEALARLRAELSEVSAGLESQKVEAVAGLRAELSKASNEQSRLAARAEEHERERDRIVEEHRRATVDLQSAHREALSQLRAQLAEAVSEQGRLAARIEETERERDRLSADHQQALTDLQNSKRDALAELRTQLAQMTDEYGGLGARLAATERERDRMSAEHHQALGDLETSKRNALADLRAQLAQMTAEHSGLAARVEAVERERDRMSAEHHQAVADLEASKRDALAGLRAQLTESSSRQSELIVRIEEHEREHEHMRAEHRRALADLQANKQETLAECERVLVKIQQQLLATDQASAEIERRVLEVIADAKNLKADSERLAHREHPPIDPAAADTADRQRPAPLTPVVQENQTISNDVESLAKVFDTGTGSNDVESLPEVFDAEDDTFVRSLIAGGDAPVPQTTAAEDRVFDAEDDTFIRRLIDGTQTSAGDAAGDDRLSKTPKSPLEDS